MNKITRPNEMQTPTVTTGPLSASRKVYSSPDGHPDIRVPLREISLTDPAEPTFPVYDTSGPYTETDGAIDVEKGLPRIREAWIKERGGVEFYEGREIKPEDNGNVSGKALARDFPNKSKPMRGVGDSLNVSVTAAVLFYEALRQRVERGTSESKDAIP